ncbi:MAG: FecR domain-containing protein [Polyangiales bacterium]
MSDASELRAHLRAPFSDARVEDLWRGVQARRAGASRRAWLALAAPALAAALVGVALRRPGAPAVTEAPAGPLVLADGAGVTAARLHNDGATPATLRLSDRSTLTLQPATALLPTRNDGRGLELQLQRGAARFEVTPGGPRRWRIDCGLATVTVVGTAFTLDRRDDALRVDVSHGTVWVDGARVPGGHRVLTAGQSLAVRDAPAAPPAVVDAPAPPPPPRPPPRVPAPAPPPAWRAQARRGDVRGAWETLGDQGFAREASTSSPAVLLELADVARRTRHHDLAAPLLERFVREHPDHSEAAMAAFTLGRDELSLRARPAAAATWFQRALALRPPRSLEEDLRARLVEAQLAAGDRAAACAAARASLAVFPQGRHAARLGRVCEPP